MTTTIARSIGRGLAWAVVVFLLAACGLVDETPDTLLLITETPAPYPPPTSTPLSETQPTVSISPLSGPPGTSLRVSAYNFPPDTAVDIGVGRVDSEYDVVAAARTGANGNLETGIVLPAFVTPQDRWVVVVAAVAARVKAVSAEFTVTEETPPAATMAGPVSRAEIYLIAVGDNGQAGKKIGCDDSVVPVEVVFEPPTDTPLPAALEELLALDGQYYGQSGLYNVFYQSDLAVESAQIKNGEAIIRLAGTLRLGGVCDDPRLRAQLEETALQFPGVQDVAIFINGEPLE
ncbi:MAG: GerMN domain-containing protein [Chloroflexota bacterium]